MQEFSATVISRYEDIFCQIRLFSWLPLKSIFGVNINGVWIKIGVDALNIL